MLLNTLKIIFITSAIVYILTVIIYKIIVQKNKSIKSSFLTVLIGFSLLIYLIAALLIIIFNPVLVNKIIMLMFFISPFVIGKLATYEQEGFYSLIQILIILFSIFYILR